MVFNGYSYRVRKRNETKTYWSCTTAGCSGSCVLINGDVLKIFSQHSHPPTPDERYKRQDFKFRIRELALAYPDVKPTDLFEMLLRELNEEAGEYAKMHRKFYTTYASAIRMKHKSGKLAGCSSGVAMEYDGYKILNKYQAAEKSVWGCARADCPAEYIFDASNDFDGKIVDHNHPPPLPHELLTLSQKK